MEEKEVRQFMERRQDKLGYLELDQLRRKAEKKQHEAELAAYRSSDPMEQARQERRARGAVNASIRLNNRFIAKYNEAKEIKGKPLG